MPNVTDNNADDATAAMNVSYGQLINIIGY